MHKEENEDRKKIDRVYEAVRKSKEYGNIKRVLKPLVQNIKSSDVAKEFLRHYAPKLKNRLRKSKERILLFKEDAKSQDPLRKAIVYLALFETTVTNVVDLVLMLFIAVHHDFYAYWTRKYAKSLDDLDDASLREKLIFLNSHSLQVFSRNINRNLRNKIAHMDFDIDADGRISIGNQKIDLEKEIEHLMVFSLCVAHALEDSGVPKILWALS